MTIESIISHRGKGKNTQHKVGYIGYTEEADEWPPRARLKGPRLDEYESSRDQPDLNTTAATFSPGDTAIIDKTLRMASNITKSVHHPALSRRRSDFA